MITAIIQTDGNDARLAYTLAALVPGVTEGLLSRAHVFGDTSSKPIMDIADAAGCDIHGADISDALKGITTPWTLMLQAGSELQPGWTSEVGRFLDASSRDETAPDAACFQIQQSGGGGYIIGSLMRVFSNSHSVEQGLICKTVQLKTAWGKSRRTNRFPPAPNSIGIKKPKLLNANITYIAG